MDDRRWARCIEPITVHSPAGGELTLQPGLCRIEPAADRNLVRQQVTDGHELTALVTGSQLEDWLTQHRLALLGW
jgi:hypothetical protein